MNHPTTEELTALIATLEKNMRTWKSQPGYLRTLEVELFCVRKVLEEAEEPCDYRAGE